VQEKYDTKIVNKGGWLGVLTHNMQWL
jgi:hypothetical protein